MIRNTRPVSWIKAARKEFERFPGGAQRDILRALTIAAEGRKADTAKPMKGLGSGVYEVALAWRGEAYRTVYIVPLGYGPLGHPCLSEKIDQRHQDPET